MSEKTTESEQESKISSLIGTLMVVESLLSGEQPNVEQVKEVIQEELGRYDMAIDSERTSEAQGEVSPLNTLVSWLKERKNEVDKKWTEAMGENGSDAETYQHLYESYSTVIGDIIMNNKEAN